MSERDAALAAFVGDEKEVAKFLAYDVAQDEWPHDFGNGSNNLRSHMALCSACFRRALLAILADREAKLAAAERSRDSCDNQATEFATRAEAAEATLREVEALRDTWNKQPGRESFAPTFADELDETLARPATTTEQKNPPDCTCEYLHRSSRACRSTAPSRGAIPDATTTGSEEGT